MRKKSRIKQQVLRQERRWKGRLSPAGKGFQMKAGQFDSIVWVTEIHGAN